MDEENLPDGMHVCDESCALESDGQPERWSEDIESWADGMSRYLDSDALGEEAAQDVTLALELIKRSAPDMHEALTGSPFALEACLAELRRVRAELAGLRCNGPVIADPGESQCG